MADQEKKETSNIELIRGLNAEALHRRLFLIDISIVGQKPKRTFNTFGALMEFLRARDLHEFLGVEDMPDDIYLEHCILPHHEADRKRLRRSEERLTGIYLRDGRYAYHCFGCMKDEEHFGIVQLTQIFSGCSRDDALAFLMDVYAIELIPSPWVRDWQDKIQKVVRFISEPELQTKYPALWAVLRTRIMKTVRILEAMSRRLNNDLTYDGQPAFTMGIEYIKSVIGGDKKTAVSTMGLLSYIGIIQKIPDVFTGHSSEQLRNRALESWEIASHKLYRYRIAVYALLSFSEEDFSKWNQAAQALLDNQFQISTFDREWLLRTMGVAAADKGFPQKAYDNAAGPSQESDETTRRMVEFVLDQIAEKGYCEERDLLQKFPGKMNRIQWGRSRSEVLLSYDLQRQRQNKQLCAGLGIPYTTPCFLILPCESKM